MTINTQQCVLNLDDLMQNTWLQIICLRHSPVFEEGKGLALWQRCVADVERVQNALSEAGVSLESRHDILLAQCALLDEVVKGRGIQDDACVQWYHLPLQGHFLQTMDAGETLCERMQQVLAQPQADMLVLTCFHRVMMLGFIGGYSSQKAPERKQLINVLTKRVAPFTCLPEQGLIINDNDPQRAGWLSSWSAKTGLAILVITGLWWCLNFWLDHLITVLLPGVRG